MWSVEKATCAFFISKYKNQSFKYVFLFIFFVWSRKQWCEQPIVTIKWSITWWLHALFLWLLNTLINVKITNCKKLSDRSITNVCTDRSLCDLLGYWSVNICTTLPLADTLVFGWVLIHNTTWISSLSFFISYYQLDSQIHIPSLSPSLPCPVPSLPPSLPLSSWQRLIVRGTWWRWIGWIAWPSERLRWSTRWDGSEKT